MRAERAPFPGAAPSPVAIGLAVTVAVIAATLSGLSVAAGSSKQEVVLPIAVAGLLGVIALSVARFDLFVALILAVRTSLDLGKIASGQSAVVDPAAALSVVFLLAGGLWLATRTDLVPASPSRLMITPLLALVAAGGASVFFSADWLTSLVELIRLGTVLVILLVLDRLIADRSRMYLVLGAVFLSAVVPLLTAAYQVITSRGLAFSGGFARVRGSFLHPNPLAIYLALLLILGVALYPHLSGWIRLALTTLLLACAGTLVLTYTRTAWIALVAGLVVVGFLQSKRVLALLGVAVLVAVLTIPSVVERFDDIDEVTTPSGATANSLQWRLQYWGEVLSLNRNPVFGIGLRMVQSESDQASLPHNDFIRTYVETGLLGLLAYVWFLVALVKAAASSVRASPPGIGRGAAVGFAGTVVAFLLISLASNVISQLVILWYFIAAAAVAGAATRLSGEASR